MDILKGLVDRRHKAVLKLAKELDDKVEHVSVTHGSSLNGAQHTYVHFWYSGDISYTWPGYTYLTNKQLLNKIREDWTNNQ